MGYERAEDEFKDAYARALAALALTLECTSCTIFSHQNPMPTRTCQTRQTIVRGR